jgi:preprotein translocase subunit SecY
MNEAGKMLILFGVVLVIAGIVLMLAGRAHLPVSRMPGDIVYRGKNTTIYFPIVTSIVLSVLLSLVLWLIGRFGR